MTKSSLKAIYNLIEPVLFWFQKILLNASYFFFLLFSKGKKNKYWVIGVDEIAANIFYISKILPDAFSVTFSPNRFYDFKYNFSIPFHNKLIQFITRYFSGPILLGFLLNKSKGFIFIWSSRFLISDVDGGNFEYKFIKSKGKKLVLIFVGDDIRSPKLVKDSADLRFEDCITNYYSSIAPYMLTQDFEKLIKIRALSAEKWGDIIITAAHDQLSYFKRKTTPFLYFFPDENFSKIELKFKSKVLIPVIVHAPSSPIIKGTQLVRAAVNRLKQEGYQFDYIEIINQPNEYVLSQLKRAHIVLNEFFALVPGLFGIEAMANYCALITSADENLESDLPKDSNKAWLVTKHFEIYDHLKLLIENPELQRNFAEKGYNWAIENAAISSTGSKFKKLINSI